MGTRQQPINCYDILGVPPTASTEEIHAAYRARIAAYHPDRNLSPDALAHAVAALITEAWQVLGASFLLGAGMAPESVLALGKCIQAFGDYLQGSTSIRTRWNRSGRS
jgi:DnaJ domain